MYRMAAVVGLVWAGSALQPTPPLARSKRGLRGCPPRSPRSIASSAVAGCPGWLKRERAIRRALDGMGVLRGLGAVR